MTQADYEAQDAADAKLAASLAKYRALVADLTAIENKPELKGCRDHAGPCGASLYLTDENVDAENVIDSGIATDDASFWDEMYSQAASAAGQRAEAYGLDINAELGRVIY